VWRTAQVTENIYDTPTGRARLIPQGARLIGVYDSQALRMRTTHHKSGRRRHEINDYWNGSVSDERDVIWPYWAFGIALVAISVITLWSL
jgi:hypothetical protein